MTPLALCVGLVLAWLAARRIGAVAEPVRLRLPDRSPAEPARVMMIAAAHEMAAIRAAVDVLAGAPPPAPAQPPISDARLRAIAIGVRSRHDHITGVTATEVTEMAVAFARQRGIELRGKP